MTARYDNTDGRMRGRRGKDRRLRIWSQDPHCAECGKLTSYPKGFQIDHRIPLFKGGLDEDGNLQVLCIACHDKKTVMEKGADLAVAFYPEWLEPALGDLTIVCGPPGSGKSRYVEQHARQHDIVIDLDLIIADMAGVPIYQANRDWLLRAAYLRNRMLSNLSRERQTAWFIVTGRGEAEREWWKRKLQPKRIVVLRESIAVCAARIKADDRRPDDVKQRHVAAVSKWWVAETGQAKGSGRLQFSPDGQVVW